MTTTGRAAAPLLLLLLLAAQAHAQDCTTTFNGDKKEFQNCEQVAPTLKLYWSVTPNNGGIDTLIEGKPAPGAYLGMAWDADGSKGTELLVAFPTTAGQSDIQVFRLDGSTAVGPIEPAPASILSRVGFAVDGTVQALVESSLAEDFKFGKTQLFWVVGKNRNPPSGSLFYDDGADSGTVMVDVARQTEPEEAAEEDEEEEEAAEGGSEEEDEAAEAEEEDDEAEEKPEDEAEAEAESESESEEKPESEDREPVAAPGGEEEEEDAASAEEGEEGSHSDGEEGSHSDGDGSHSDTDGSHSDGDGSHSDGAAHSTDEGDPESEEETAEPSPAVCVGAEHLADMPADSLVFTTHRASTALCDASDSCATPGHIVTYRGAPMAMRTYCAAHADGGCTSRDMLVNSPRMRAGLRVASKTEGLLFTPLAASHGTWLEEQALRMLVRLTGV